MADEKLFGIGKFDGFPIPDPDRGYIYYRKQSDAIPPLDDCVMIRHRNKLGQLSWQQVLLAGSITVDVIPDEDWTRFLGNTIKNWWAVYTHGLYVTTDVDIWVGANLVPDGVQNLGGPADRWQDLFLDRYLRLGRLAALPPAAAEHRGKQVVLEGTGLPGNPDTVWVCLLTAPDTYTWVQVA